MSGMMSLVGLASLQKSLGKLAEDQTEKLEKAVISAALLVMNDAKRKAPYLRGNLRSSIHIGGVGNGLGTPAPKGGDMTGTDIGGMERTNSTVKVDVGTNVEYAAAQEYGTGNMEAQPYLRPAYDENIEKVAKEIAEVMKS